VPASKFIHTGLQCNMGDHTTLQAWSIQGSLVNAADSLLPEK